MPSIRPLEDFATRTYDIFLTEAEVLSTTLSPLLASRWNIQIHKPILLLHIERKPTSES